MLIVIMFSVDSLIDIMLIESVFSVILLNVVMPSDVLTIVMVLNVVVLCARALNIVTPQTKETITEGEAQFGLKKCMKNSYVQGGNIKRILDTNAGKQLSQAATCLMSN